MTPPSIPLLAFFLIAAQPHEGLALNQYGGSSSPPAAPTDPWALTHACTAVLDRYAACRADKTMKRVVAAWAKAAEGRRKGAQAAVETTLQSWARRDRRRQQCAAWVDRSDIKAHLGPESKLAELAEEKSTTCAVFARALDEDGWVPQNLDVQK